MKWLLFFLVLLVPFTVAQPCQENQQRQCGITDVGACSYGVQICQGGQWSVCYGNIDPVNEICDNNKDDDCDGQIDEGCLCVADTERQCEGSRVGICQPGYQTCINGTEWSSCFNQTLPLANELCDNKLDDDCDGQIDEGCQQNITRQTTCFNGIQDGDETEIDCGGSCRACASCTDGILNQGEYKVSVDLAGGTISDCGGPNCPGCPTCSDGIRNQGEQGVDCGGPCSSCVAREEEDADKDGLSYALELRKGTDPLKADTDGDGIDDNVDRYPLCPNTLCDDAYGETEKNCPEDCKEASSLTSLGVIFLIFILLIGVIGFYFWYQFKRSTKTVLSTSEKKREPVYIDKGLLERPSGKQHQSKVDRELEKSFEKVEKMFK